MQKQSYPSTKSTAERYYPFLWWTLSSDVNHICPKTAVRSQAAGSEFIYSATTEIMLMVLPEASLCNWWAEVRFPRTTTSLCVVSSQHCLLQNDKTGPFLNITVLQIKLKGVAKPEQQQTIHTEQIMAKRCEA